MVNDPLLYETIWPWFHRFVIENTKIVSPLTHFMPPVFLLYPLKTSEGTSRGYRKRPVVWNEWTILVKRDIGDPFTRFDVTKIDLVFSRRNKFFCRYSSTRPCVHLILLHCFFSTDIFCTNYISDSSWDSRNVSLIHKVQLVPVIQSKLFLLFQNFRLCQIFNLNFPLFVINFDYWTWEINLHYCSQKQPSRGVLKKRCSEKCSKFTGEHRY